MFSSALPQGAAAETHATFVDARLAQRQSRKRNSQNLDDVQLFEKAGIVPMGQIRLVRSSGVDCSRFLPPNDERAPEGRPFLIVLAARMLWDKGVGEFVEAARLLKSEGRQLRFILAGVPDPGNPAAIAEETLLGCRRRGLWSGWATLPICPPCWRRQNCGFAQLSRRAPEKSD